MYLKSLKLVGFKSFADRTRLELRPGVTVVVGPNGSGKSNIVDAVAWVMGTQAPKSLRTSKMEDVIFAGTATRPGFARAEVTLVLDNSSGEIAMDLPEVSITRRLYRDGSSDYEINGVSCRLLDIQELLADSSIGKHQHVIIGQGQIESILNATAEEHRAVIEEAAGIRKHRVRKDRALVRLERTAQDAQRVEDIIAEIARQMRPLKRQAAAAARHADVAAAARSLRLFLAGEELRRISARRAALALESDRNAADLAEAEAEAISVGETLGELRRKAGTVGEALDRDSGAAARLETTIERLRRLGQVAHERRRSIETRIEGAGERRHDLEAELAQLAEDLTAAEAEERNAQSLEVASETAFRALELEERSLADQEGSSVEGALAIVRVDLRSLAAASERDERELRAVTHRASVLEGQLDQERSDRAAIDAEIKSLDAEATSAGDLYREAELKRRSEQEAWEQASEALAEARVRVAAARARAEAIESAVAGLADPEARSLVEASPGSAGSITAVLDVPAEYAAAVDAALGPWADAIAFSDRSALYDAVAALKGAGRGGVPMVALDQTSASEAVRAAMKWGATRLIDVLGPASDPHIAAALLGDVVVAEGWNTGWRIVSETPGIRCVTPEGDLITPSGVRVSHPDGATPAMLELAEAEVESAERDLARCESLVNQAKRGFDAARGSERVALEALERLEARLAGAAETLGRLGRAIASGETELQRLADRRTALESATAEHSASRLRLQGRLSALEGEEADRQRAWDEMNRRRSEVATAREEARSAWQEASARQRAAAERLMLLAKRREVVRAAMEHQSFDPPDPRRLEQLAAIEERSAAALETLRAHVGVLRKRQAELRENAGETGRLLGEAQARHDQLTRLSSDLKDSRAAAAIEVAQLEVRAESVAEGLRRDLDVDEATSLAEPRPEGENLSELLASREAELRRMGPVNPLAQKEYTELAERHAFLTAQLDDLQRSARDLRRVVKALDEEIASQFADAFNEIAAYFSEYFAVLFPGGRGRLSLADPDSPLTSGVEIEAQPMGKKLAKMSLLSGGERSLASLAFLFSVFRSRPSPFYVLDEVEAALDDANLRRFLRLLGSFREGAQLVIVTHQQQTMEAADVLYGVTMEPGGSSRVVAKPLSHLASATLG